MYIIGITVFLGALLLGTLLYFLMIMPRMPGRPDTDYFKQWLYAHRGLHDNKSDAPENSMRAFEKAVEAGFGIELDIQLSRDRVPVVFHDFALKRICGCPGKVSDYTWEELSRFSLCGSGEYIPRLEDVLKMVNGRVPLIVEFKIERFDLSLCREADRLLSAYQGKYCMESFHPLGVLWYRRNRKDIVRGQLSDGFLREGEYSGVLYFLLQNLCFNWLGKPDFIAYNHKYPNILSRRLCHELYKATAAAWTVKSEEELQRARRNFDIFIFDSFLPKTDCGARNALNGASF